MTLEQRNGGSPYLTPKDVAILLHCDLKTVHNLRVKGVLKRHSMGGRRVYYLRSEVESAMFPLD
jgi:hypothetical protein